MMLVMANGQSCLATAQHMLKVVAHARTKAPAGTLMLVEQKKPSNALFIATAAGGAVVGYSVYKLSDQAKTLAFNGFF